MRLNAHVERAYRLVGDDDPGFQHEGAGDGDALALALAPVELVWVAVRGVGAEANPVEDAQHVSAAAVSGADVVDDHRLGHNVAHSLARVERREGVQKDHLHDAALAPARFERLHYLDQNISCVRHFNYQYDGSAPSAHATHGRPRRGPA